MNVEALIKIDKNLHKRIIIFRFNQNFNRFSWCIWYSRRDYIRKYLSWISGEPELISKDCLRQRSYWFIPSCQTVRTGCIALYTNVYCLTDWKLPTLKKASIRTFLFTINQRIWGISGIHLRAISAYVDIWIRSVRSCYHFEC